MKVKTTMKYTWTTDFCPFTCLFWCCSGLLWNMDLGLQAAHVEKSNLEQELLIWISAEESKLQM